MPDECAFPADMSVSSSANICRACLSTTAKLISLDTAVRPPLRVLDFLKSHLNIVVSKNDGLPFKMCLGCLHKLLLIRQFHLCYLESEQILLSQCVGGKLVEETDKITEDEASRTSENTLVDNEHIEDVSSGMGLSFLDTNSFDSDTEEQSFVSKTIVEIEPVNEDEYLTDPLRTSTEIEVESDQKTEDVDLQRRLKFENGCDIAYTELNQKDSCQKLNGVKEPESKCSAFESNEDHSIDEASEIANAEAFIGTFRVKKAILIYCMQCHEFFRTKEEARQHIHSEHKGENDRLFCRHCQIALPDREKLIDHLKKTHNYRKPRRLSCSFCDKTFAHKTDVTQHERTHTGEKPFICSICNKGFGQKQTLKTHMSLHTGKTIQCELCDKSFCREAFLRIHLRSHYDLRPYECHLCNKKYRNQNHLKTHMSSHSETRDFMCDVCGGAFKRQCDLRHHMNSHIRPYQCPKCPLRGAKLYTFRNHLVKMHNIHDDPKLFRIKQDDSGSGSQMYQGRSSKKR